MVKKEFRQQRWICPVCQNESSTQAQRDAHFLGHGKPEDRTYLGPNKRNPDGQGADDSPGGG